MIGAGVGGGGAVGIEEGRGMRFHFHLGMTASEGDLGGIGGIFVHEEIEDIDGLGVLCGNGGRRRWRFGGWINDCNGILGVGVEGIFNVGFAWHQGGGSRVDFDGFLELFRRFLFVEGALVLLRLGHAGLGKDETSAVETRVG